MLGEKTKQAEIESFKKLKADYNIDEEKFFELEKEIAETKDSISTLSEKQNTIKTNFENEAKKITQEIEELKNKIAEIKKNFSFSEKLLYFLHLKKIVEQATLKQNENDLKEMKTNYEKELNELLQQQNDLTEKLKNQNSEKEKILEKAKQLVEFEDGKIIGDGRSDFTRENHIYEFQYDNYKFNLIDIPGIEGKESEVQETIWNAVKKAHAVFYITNKAARPQTGGDEGKKGTAEKIKEHLGKQTEVWTIFNQSITNPIQMKNDLVNKDEQKSLADLDDTMKKLFNEHYCKTISVAALPAFLSKTECLALDSDRYKKRTKFLKAKSSDEIFSFSNMSEVKSVLEKTSTDAPKKIRKANLNKAQCVLQDTITGIDTELKDNIEPIVNKLEIETKNTNEQIDLVVKKLSSDLQNHLEQKFSRIKNKIQDEIYEYIDYDVKNSDFKNRLKDLLEDAKPKIQKFVKEVFTNDIEKFSSEITPIIEKYKTRLKEFSTLMSDMHLNADILDNNIKDFDGKKITETLAATVSLGLAIAAAFAAAGPFAIIAAVLAVLTGIAIVAKKIGEALSHNFKKSNQREAADKTLSKFEDNFFYEMNKQVKQTHKEVSKKIETIKEMIWKSSNDLKAIKEIIQGAKKNLIELKNDTEIFDVA